MIHGWVAHTLIIFGYQQDSRGTPEKLADSAGRAWPPLTHLGQVAREVIAVVVHQMVAVAAKLVAQLLDYAAHLLVGEVRAADLDALAELELVAQFVMIAGRDFEDAREGEGVTTVGELRSKGLYARVEYAEADRGGVLVDPVLQKQIILLRDSIGN